MHFMFTKQLNAQTIEVEIFIFHLIKKGNLLCHRLFGKPTHSYAESESEFKAIVLSLAQQKAQHDARFELFG